MRYLVESFRHGCDLDPKIADSNQRLLTIHIRSGDIFETNIHPPYGQPPLAFYLRAIAHYQPDLITLVFENMSNPVISSLIEHVRGLKLPLTVSSSTDLRDDIRTLVAARALVIGKGTFALGVLCLNDRVREVYTFNGSSGVRHVLPSDPKGQIKCHNIIDRERKYVESIMKSNWQNTEEQRQLMVTYSPENLDITTETI